MLNLDHIKQDSALIDDIDWEMTPEEAVRLYLEWGNNWASGNYVIRSPQDVAYYFVLNTWGERPVVYLVKRSSEEAEELAVLELPRELEQHCRSEYGSLKGVFAVEGAIKEWLQSELSIQSEYVQNSPSFSHPENKPF